MMWGSVLLQSIFVAEIEVLKVAHYRDVCIGGSEKIIFETPHIKYKMFGTLAIPHLNDIKL